MRRLYKHIQARFCTANDTVLFSQHRHLAKVTLNKPKALNALDLHIVRAIAKKQATWHEPEVKVVWIVGAGGKAFCAGGDVRSLYDAKVIGNAEDQWILDAFFREEYTLDFKLSVMKPTQISVMDGIVMGGGVGISVHAPIKIATEHSLFAMPGRQSIRGGRGSLRLSHQLSSFDMTFLKRLVSGSSLTWQVAISSRVFEAT